MQQYLLPALFAFVLTFGLIRGALKLFPKIGLMDRPHKYGLKRDPIPYYGGTLIVIGFLVSVFLFVPMQEKVMGLLLGAILIAGVSFMDDLQGLSPWFRLGVQVLSALILVGAGIGIHSISNPFGAPIVFDGWMISVTLDQVYQLSLMATLFTIVWVVAIVNTMNWLDGLNGLPSGVTTIASLTLFFLSIRPGLHFDPASQVPVAMMSIILCACAFAFWLHDFYPAKILMGDTGSMFFGYLVAALAIFSGGKVATAFLVLGFPILDAGWVIIRRILQKKSPLKGDLKHFHHRLLESGFSQRKALVLIYTLCAIFGGTAVLLEGQQKVYAVFVLLVLMVILGTMAVYMGGKKKGDVSLRR